MTTPRHRRLCICKRFQDASRVNHSQHAAGVKIKPASRQRGSRYTVKVCGQPLNPTRFSFGVTKPYDTAVAALRKSGSGGGGGKDCRRPEAIRKKGALVLNILVFLQVAHPADAFH